MVLNPDHGVVLSILGLTGGEQVDRYSGALQTYQSIGTQISVFDVLCLVDWGLGYDVYLFTNGQDFLSLFRALKILYPVAIWIQSKCSVFGVTL